MKNFFENKSDFRVNVSAVFYCILQRTELGGAPTQVIELLLPSGDGLLNLDEQQSIHEEAVQAAQVRHTTSNKLMSSVLTIIVVGDHKF